MRQSFCYSQLAVKLPTRRPLWQDIVVPVFLQLHVPDRNSFAMPDAGRMVSSMVLAALALRHHITWLIANEIVI
jgi:hypothetical protein